MVNHVNCTEMAGSAFHEKFLDMLDSQTRRDILENTHEHIYAPKNIIFQQDDICDRVTIIISGNITLSIFSEDGKEIIIAEKSAGDILSAAEMILGCHHLANGITTNSSRVVTLARPAFSALMERPGFANTVLTTLSRSMRETLRFAESLAIHSLETRLARLLISLEHNHGRLVGDGILIDRVVSQGRLGQMINASRPKINAQLRAWQSRDLIRLRDGRIVILDPETLRRVSQLPD